MRFRYWITKATDRHSEYVILIANQQQLWMHERASLLRHTYIKYLCFIGWLAANISRSFGGGGNINSLSVVQLSVVWLLMLT